MQLILIILLLTSTAFAALKPGQEDLKAQIDFAVAQYWYDAAAANFDYIAIRSDKSQVDALGAQFKASGLNWKDIDWLKPPSKVNWSSMGI